MRAKKADWTLVKEAETEGFMASMTGIVERNRTPLNNELSDYFRRNMPRYSGSCGEEEAEEVLSNINTYLEEHHIEKHPINFPISSGTDLHLVPITENLHLKLTVADEYHGSGDYSQYVMADFFMINENTTKQDVEDLISFVKRYLML